MKKYLKKLIYYLQLFDGIWSVPLGFLAFFFSGLLLSSAFGLAVGTYDIGFVQPLFLAGTIVIGATNMAVWGLRFTFKSLYHYLYGKKVNGVIVNASKVDWHNNISPIQRICVSLLVFCFFVLCIIIVYLHLV